MFYRSAQQELLRRRYPLLYREQIESCAQTYHLPRSLLCAVIWTESKFEPEAQSPVGASGLMQLMPETFLWLTKKTGENLPAESRWDPEINMRYGSYFLSRLYREFGEWDAVCAAYNAGPGRVREWLKNETVSSKGRLVAIPIEETAEYVLRVRRAEEIYRTLYFPEDSSPYDEPTAENA